MIKAAKKVKAVVCASILAVSTIIVSLVPAVKAEAAVPTGCSISIVTQDEYKAGETVKIKTVLGDATGNVTYEFYSNSNYAYPYYGLPASTSVEYYYYMNILSNGYKAFSVDKTGVTTGDEVVIDIPSSARGTYTVKAVFTNADGETVATADTKLSVKNSSYDSAFAYYYYMNGNGGSSSVPYWYYYLLSNNDNTDKDALLYYYYYMNNQNGSSSTVPVWYYYYLINNDSVDKDALIYYYYLNNNGGNIPYYYLYLLNNKSNS